MIKDEVRFSKAIAAFDALNSKDPNIEVFEGKDYAKEILYAQRMSQRLLVFEPDASEALQLAARCQHLCRWEIARNEYPTGRVGYHQWRNRLKKLHADKAGEILTEVGYNQEVIKRVQFLVLKKQLKKEAATQILEDVICLVFLEFYFAKFAAKHTEEKVIDILRKTWQKMSERGQAAALQLPLSADAKAIIGKALTT